jgi:hypothetical protein
MRSSLNRGGLITMHLIWDWLQFKREICLQLSAGSTRESVVSVEALIDRRVSENDFKDLYLNKEVTLKIKFHLKDTPKNSLASNLTSRGANHQFVRIILNSDS